MILTIRFTDDSTPDTLVGMVRSVEQNSHWLHVQHIVNGEEITTSHVKAKVASFHVGL